MYFDGSLKLEGEGVGVLLISPKGEQLKYVLHIFWKVSNNEAEYEALLHGPLSHPEHGRTAQAQLAMGRSLLSLQGD
jgi:ribonuclease HI